ncbi:hypothetical protein BDZ97DRAFT_1831800 [Flammula alnicola]|nr:hypothetical protein BDZ97DRAFT_1831800 [Flammula alnicola]
MTALPALNFGPFIVIITPAFSLTLPARDTSPHNPDVPFNLNFNTQTHQAPHPLTGHTDPPPAVAFLRAYHHQGDHFYTTDRSEMQNATSATTYTAEGTACDIFTTHQPSTIPLFRLYSSAANDHLYTTSAAERDHAVARCGYASEGVAGFVYPTADRGGVPLFRLYKAENVDHFYTTSAAEARHSIMMFGYADEGIACYVLPA